MGFPRQEYWSRLPFSFPGDLPDPGIKPTSPALAGRLFTTEPPEKPRNTDVHFQIKTTEDLFLQVKYSGGIPLACQP